MVLLAPAAATLMSQPWWPPDNATQTRPPCLANSQSASMAGRLLLPWPVAALVTSLVAVLVAALQTVVVLPAVAVVVAVAVAQP